MADLEIVNVETPGGDGRDSNRNYRPNYNGDRRGGDSRRPSGNKSHKPKLDKEARTQLIVKRMWIGFGSFVGVVLLFFIAVYNGWIGYMPPVEELKNPQDKFASIIYSADGQEMGRYFKSTGNRIYADYDEISQHVVDALVATEDSRFESHSGIDIKALSRAVVKTVILRQKSAGGGSTITQQLAKQLYTPPSDGFFSRLIQKPIEWMIAIKLERYYSKEEIIKMYLNQFDFLYNAVGIKSAAQVYFNKEARNLNIQEAALLVGMVKNPAYFNPIRKPERALGRRNVVLQQMLKAGKIDQDAYDSLSQTPLGLNFHRIDHKQGIAPYFREELRRYLTAKKPQRSDYPSWDQQRYVDDSIQWATNPLYGWQQKNPKADGSYYDIYNDGLRIYTTIDSKMQAYAEQAVGEHMKSLQVRFDKEKKGSATAPYTSNRDELSDATRQKLIQNAIRQSERYRVAKVAGLSDSEIDKQFNTRTDMTVFSYHGEVDTTMTPRDSILYVKSFLRTGFMAMDPRNGHVKAYVGGPDFKFFQYDMVSTGRRQVGSTIKPFLYTLAMEDGFSPCSTFLNSQPVLTDASGNVWAPRNSSSARVGEMVDLRWALTNSNNWISARVINEVGPSRLVTLMHNLGITNKIPSVMSLALGPCEVSVREMVGAYTAFANKGMRVDPIYVTAIADNNGNIISQFTPNQTEVISEKAYYRILSILLNVVDGGTGNRLRRAPYNLVAQLGGKTGTTNNNSDGWFMGFTPEIVGGVWVGGDERYIHFNTMANGQGAEMALPIFGKFMSKVYADPSLPYNQNTRFVFPNYISLCDGGGDIEDDVEEASVDDVFD
jgi:penicillin-binding protein 1A